MILIGTDLVEGLKFLIFILEYRLHGGDVCCWFLEHRTCFKAQRFFRVAHKYTNTEEDKVAGLRSGPFQLGMSAEF